MQKSEWRAGFERSACSKWLITSGFVQHTSTTLKNNNENTDLASHYRHGG